MYRSLIFILLFNIVGIGTQNANAELFIWTDSNGVKHYSNTQAPEEASGIKKDIEITQQNKNIIPGKSSPRIKPAQQQKTSHKKTVVKRKSRTDSILCNDYKNQLETYLKYGVVEPHPVTGQKIRLTGDKAAMAIQNANDAIKIFCN